jgi:hypothetical protein
MMDDKARPEVEDDQDAAGFVPPNPEERAFTGHPDHPPSSPDQSVEANEEILERPESGDQENTAPPPE